MSKTTDAVLEIVSNHTKAKPESITPATLLENLGIDSMGIVEMMFELEEKFDIEIPQSADIATRYTQFMTPADIVATVNELIDQKK